MADKNPYLITKTTEEKPSSFSISKKSRQISCYQHSSSDIFCMQKSSVLSFVEIPLYIVTP